MIIESREDVFFEDIFPYKQEEDKTSGKRTYEIAFRDKGPSEQTIDVKVEPRRSKISKIFKSFGSDFIAYTFKSELQYIKELCLPQKYKYGKKMKTVKKNQF